MLKITRFSLERHGGRHAAGPETPRLIADGVTLDMTLPGHTLLRQFETAAGYLLVTDSDGVYEEAIRFTLIDKDCTRILSHREIGAPSRTYRLADIVWKDPWRFEAILEDSPLVARFTIRRFHIPGFYPQLGLDFPQDHS